MSDYDKQVFDELVASHRDKFTAALAPIIEELSEGRGPEFGSSAAAAMCYSAGAFIAHCFAPDFGSSETQAAVVQVMAEELTKRFLDSTGRVAELTAMAAMRSAFGTDFDPEMN